MANRKMRIQPLGSDEYCYIERIAQESQGRVAGPSLFLLTPDTSKLPPVRIIEAEVQFTSRRRWPAWSRAIKAAILFLFGSIAAAQIPGLVDCKSARTSGSASIRIVTDDSPDGVCAEIPASVFTGTKAIAADPVNIQIGPRAAAARDPRTGALLNQVPPNAPIKLTPEQLLLIRLLGHADEDRAAIERQAATSAGAAAADFIKSISLALKALAAKQAADAEATKAK